MTVLANTTASGLHRELVLWTAMKEGNESAFREIFEIYSNLLFQYGITISKERELVKDCVQDLFITIWTKRQNLGFARSTRYYLFFSLRRLILKKIGKAEKVFSLSKLSHIRSIPQLQDHAMLINEIATNHHLVISGAVKALPARQREIIFLKFYQDLRNEEIGRIMNLNNQVVRNTLYRALKSLKRELVEQTGTTAFSSR